MKVLGLNFKVELNVLYDFVVCEYIYIDLCFDVFLIEYFLSLLYMFLNCLDCLKYFLIWKCLFFLGFNILKDRMGMWKVK